MEGYACATSIAVSGNIVYIGGYYSNGKYRDVRYWKRDVKKISENLILKLETFDYKTVSFEWKTYWAENADGLDCTAHVILGCADINLSRGNNWNYFDRIINPGGGWKWASWNFSSPIGTVADRPNIRCAYGYGKREMAFWPWETDSYYDLSGTVPVIVTVQK
jgi:hypothetical protein